MTKAPAYLDLAHCSAVPCREFLFGTDTMGRDIFSMIWYGGRLSLFIGVGSTVISTLRASEYVIAAKCMGGSFSTFCGVTLRRISSRPSSSWW